SGVWSDVDSAVAAAVRTYQRALHDELPFFLNDTGTTCYYTLSLHDALPIYEKNQSHHRRYRDAGHM
ncbi:hypothetical protein, partial [Salmonella enterica]|uniref:hypothetical protein n=1 Tax=Salmonella enterica TaxID=28901 RepID=UPI001ADA5E70